jgi:hypothetical protein
MQQCIASADEATDMLADFELGRLAWDGPLAQLASPRFEGKEGALGTADSGWETHCASFASLS